MGIRKRGVLFPSFRFSLAILTNQHRPGIPSETGSLEAREAGGQPLRKDGTQRAALLCTKDLVRRHANRLVPRIHARIMCTRRFVSRRDETDTSLLCFLPGTTAVHRR